MSIQKILVVDDSATDRFYLTELLQTLGFNVITAESGDQSLLLAESEKPDLILMDIVMPGLTGFEATRKLTKNPLTSHIPIIICSGKASVTDRPWALKMGARECLPKPIAADSLLGFIRSIDTENRSVDPGDADPPPW